MRIWVQNGNSTGKVVDVHLATIKSKVIALLSYSNFWKLIYGEIPRLRKHSTNSRVKTAKALWTRAPP